jgi:cytochrome c-type biogenesis protein CcmH
MALIGFWIVAGALTAAVVLVLRRALATGMAADGEQEPARRIYRDQLSEIDADLARGLITAADAASARLEIQRRLLATDGGLERAAAADGPRSTALPPRVGLGLSAALPIAAIGLYMVVGSPGAGDHPFADQADRVAEARSMAALVSNVEARLKEAPDDGRGWDVIAPFYLRQERFADAIVAYGNAIRLQGETAQRLMGLGEAHIFNAQGQVGPEARQILARARDLAPDAIEPRLWLTIAKEQDGKLAEAVQEYRAMLAGGAPDAPWREAVSERAQLVEGIMKAGPRPGPVAKGPTLDDVTAAKALSPDQRQQMIEQMVSGLATRLQADGRDAEGWQKLVRAYVVLGRRDDALKALANARTALAGDAAGLGGINALAQSLGLGS